MCYSPPVCETPTPWPPPQCIWGGQSMSFPVANGGQAARCDRLSKMHWVPAPSSRILRAIARWRRRHVSRSSNGTRPSYRMSWRKPVRAGNSRGAGTFATRNTLRRSMPARSCRGLTVSPTWLPNTLIPSHAFLLHLVPEFVERLQGRATHLQSAFLRELLHLLEPFGELRVGSLEGLTRLDAELP